MAGSPEYLLQHMPHFGSPATGGGTDQVPQQPAAPAKDAQEPSVAADGVPSTPGQGAQRPMCQHGLFWLCFTDD